MNLFDALFFSYQWLFKISEWYLFPVKLSHILQTGNENCLTVFGFRSNKLCYSELLITVPVSSLSYRLLVGLKSPSAGWEKMDWWLSRAPTKTIAWVMLKQSWILSWLSGIQTTRKYPKLYICSERKLLKVSDILNIVTCYRCSNIKESMHFKNSLSTKWLLERVERR